LEVGGFKARAGEVSQLDGPGAVVEQGARAGEGHKLSGGLLGVAVGPGRRAVQSDASDKTMSIASTQSDVFPKTPAEARSRG
jgi:hypothetical protein